MWHIYSCQGIDRENNTNLYVLLCPNTLRHTGAPSSPFCHSNPCSLQHQLQELIELHGHLCNFYPKYHYELNFIEQYWGEAKFCFCVAGHMTIIKEMEKKVIQCLDHVPLLHIQQWVIHVFISDSCLPHCLSSYANRSAHFISAYQAGLSGSQAIWANQKCHSHHTLPLEIIAEIKHSVIS
jgi:hypothetical protein